MGNKNQLSGIDYDLIKEQKEFYDRLLVCARTFIKWSQRDSYCSALFEDVPRLLNISTIHIDSTAFIPGSFCRNFRRTRTNPIYWKQLCLITTLYKILYCHWLYKQQRFSKKNLNHCVNYLENIATKGLDSFKVRGNIVKGWRLK